MQQDTVPGAGTVAGRQAHYEAVLGRGVSRQDLARLERTRGLLELRVPSLVRRRAARIIATW